MFHPLWLNIRFIYIWKEISYAFNDKKNVTDRKPLSLIMKHKIEFFQLWHSLFILQKSLVKNRQKLNFYQCHIKLHV